MTGRAHRRASPLGWHPALLLGLLGFFTTTAAAQPRVGVVESTVAASWLRAAGLECMEITGDTLAASVPDVPLLIVPLDRVRSEAMVRALSLFTARGGKVIAVYWGTIARPEQQSLYPVYRAAPLLGLRVTGWTLTGAAVVRPEAPATGSATSEAAADRAPALTSGTELRLSEAMVIQVDPEPNVPVLARLMPSAGGTPLALALRNGNIIYVAANLFAGGDHSPELRRLFFWAVDQATPNLMFSEARERAGAAVAAVIRARERLPGLPAPTAEAARKLLEEAQTTAERAKALAAGSDFTGSLAAADQSLQTTERALRVMERH